MNFELREKYCISLRNKSVRGSLAKSGNCAKRGLPAGDFLPNFAVPKGHETLQKTINVKSCY